MKGLVSVPGGFTVVIPDYGFQAKGKNRNMKTI
jgi:hypothetical protein